MDEWSEKKTEGVQVEYKGAMANKCEYCKVVNVDQERKGTQNNGLLGLLRFPSLAAHSQCGVHHRGLFISLDRYRQCFKFARPVTVGTAEVIPRHKIVTDNQDIQEFFSTK